MKRKDTVLAAALMILSLPGAGLQQAEATGEKIFAAKLQMQFSQAFEIENVDGVSFAFQERVGEKSRKHLEKLPAAFGDTFKALVDHPSGLNEGLRIVIFDSKGTYNKEFSTSSAG
jgi:hypothetical protein